MMDTTLIAELSPLEAIRLAQALERAARRAL